jgi:hypothetical protein
MSFRSIRVGVFEALAEHIERRLKERAFCIVFEDELERCWPGEKIERAEREKQIQTFAESRGWTASVLNSNAGRTRAIFRRQS